MGCWLRQGRWPVLKPCGQGLAQAFKKRINSALLFDELICKECCLVRVDAVMVESGFQG